MPERCCSLNGIRQAIRHSMEGLKIACAFERAFKQELLLGIVWLPLSCLLTKNSLEFAWMLGTWLLVLMVELLNSSVEAVVNRIGLKQHEMSKRAKDLASAAVFLALLQMPLALAAIIIKNYI